MSQLSCISHPSKHPSTMPSLIIHPWFVVACGGDLKQAALLSYFEIKHNAKIDIDAYHNSINDDATQAGVLLQLDADTVIEIKLGVLREHLHNIASERAISKALDDLCVRGFISLQRNPDPSKILDRKKYVRFHPEVINGWIRQNYDLDGSFIGKLCSDLSKKKRRSFQKEGSIMQEGSIDYSKLQNRDYETEESRTESHPHAEDIAQVVEFSDSAEEKSRFYEKEESVYINNQYQSIQSTNSINQSVSDDFDQTKKVRVVNELEAVIDALVVKGFARERFNYADAKPAIERLLKAGAMVETFLAALDVASAATQGKGFGVNYLTKVVESLMKKTRRVESQFSPTTGSNARRSGRQESIKSREYVYKHNLKNAESWAGDLI